ncbi:hypothetical protein SAMN05877831_11914 [Rhodobacter maris]|uniref:Uncharacterized protein n=2 Tax=Rhodobacter maris TaxID=446682 RepID=A0A285TE14_9RHOB|nr:hypothetical protein SAMN05877831_11914 [Rhodobacter maris]
MWCAGVKGDVAKAATAAALMWTIIGVAAAETPVGPGMEGEEAFLDVLPKVAVPADVQPISGAVNEPWRSCQSLWPQEYRQTQQGPEARAYRDIYGFVQAKEVIEVRNCSCATKAADWAQVERIASGLRQSTGTEILKWVQTQEISEEADKLIAVAEAMCAGPF